jgi:hypothetical protein
MNTPRAPAPSAYALMRIMATVSTSDRQLWAGEILFVMGWSLMWASALDILAIVPVEVCPLLMAAGLTLGGYAIRNSACPPPSMAADRTAAAASSLPKKPVRESGTPGAVVALVSIRPPDAADG